MESFSKECLGQEVEEWEGLLELATESHWKFQANLKVMVGDPRQSFWQCETGEQIKIHVREFEYKLTIQVV